MDFLTAVIPWILEPLVTPIKRHLSYVFGYMGKANTLRDEVQALQGDINIMLSSIGRGEEAVTYVQEWQSRAETAITDAQSVVRNAEEEAQRGCSLRFKTRYRIGKQAADGTSGIVRLREERGRFGTTIAHPFDLQPIVPPPVKDYEAESRTDLLNKVMAALTDPCTAIVGVHGAGGIGKTTLAKAVLRRATDNKLFDKVVLTKVSATPNLRSIQDEIAEYVIGPKLQESTEGTRASRLNQNLKDCSKDTRILIILDDLWQHLELATLGIPTGYDGHGCKILLTSRRVDLLSDMGSKKNFHVGLLSEKESMSLFEKEVVEVRDNRIAEEIVVKCGGFPLLIVTAAGLVRNKELPAWKDALTQLSKYDNQELHDKVYAILNLSYERLPCDETKSIFLLCGICSRADTTLLNLLSYSLGLGLLKDYTISDARNRLETLIENLKTCSLLDVDSEGNIKMHDVVRDMCIAHKDQRAFKLKDGNVLKEWPHNSDIGTCSRVSLPYIDIHQLPEDLGCPDVEFLLFFSKWHSTVPDSTFLRTQKLRVVHFSGMDFPSLPGSLHSLTNLHTLCLEKCHLLDIAGIGQMKTLEVLSFRGSDLDALPVEMGNLTGLKLLDLTNCDHLDFIPADVLSKMTSLEELLMLNGFDNWEIEESSSGRKARLSELKFLSRLKSLEIRVPNFLALPKDLFFSDMDRYKIIIGDSQSLWYSAQWMPFVGSTKMMMLETDCWSTDLLQQLRGLLEESDSLSLFGTNGLKNLFYELDSQGFRKLKRLHIEDSDELQQIVDCRKRGGATTVYFPLLEYLELLELGSAVTICKGRPSPDSFRKIRKLCIYGCKKMKYLLSVYVVRGLLQLEEILVTRCDVMEALFVEESDCDEAVELPQLRRLILVHLPELKWFIKYERESLSESYAFFREKVALPNLEELFLGAIGDIKMIWCNQLPSSSFGKLNSLSIKCCHELQTVFPYGVAERFQSLKSLNVSDCGLLEEIYNNDMSKSAFELKRTRCDRFEEIVVGEKFSSNSSCPLLPQLTSLTLKLLPELTSFHLDSYTWSWPNLSFVKIRGCLKARIFSGQEASHTNDVQTFFSLEKMFPNLERMSIDGRIWKSVMESQSWLTRLKSLELSSLKGTLTEASRFGSIPTVRDLQVGVKNSHIRQLWSSNMSGFDAGSPSLTRLQLYEVKGLRYVWRPDSTMDPLLPYLEILQFSWCVDLISFAPSPSASFGSLSTLELTDCSKLTELVKPSTAATMTNLVTLRIWSCRALKEIVSAVDDGDQTTRKLVIFNRLKTLDLRVLDSLEGFCMSSRYSFNFPRLEEVSIWSCHSMRIFCNGDVATPKLQKVDSQGTRRWKGDLNTTVKQHYQVEMQNIATLRLSRFPELVERWGRELPFIRFSNLYKLVIDNCPLLAVALPSNFLPAVTGCKSLIVEKCHSVEEILDCDGADQNECHNGLMHRVSYLKLTELPKLRHIWNFEDPPGISCFKNLGRLNVFKCSSLTHIFALPVALGLVHLYDLQIEECSLVEVIIKLREDEKPPADSDHSTIFPKLENVKLENLPTLTGFYSGNDLIRCPALDRASVVGCPRVCLLRSSASSTKHKESMHDDVVNEPTLHIFNEQVEILGLKEVVVQWNSSMDKAWHEIVPPSFLLSLESVRLIGFPTVNQLFPSDFAKGMPKLCGFAIDDSLYEQKLKENSQEMPEGSFGLSEHLELFNLLELKCLIKEESQSGSMFQHLRELRVSKCKGLTCVLTYSTAMILVNLKLLVVKECERMMEIVSSHGDEIGDEIVFRKLHHLELDGLMCLTSFSSGDYTLSFPLLETVICKSCPNMRTFSKNIPSTPTLEEVQFGEDDDEDAWRWEGNLNSTVEKNFTEKNPSSN